MDDDASSSYQSFLKPVPALATTASRVMSAHDRHKETRLELDAAETKKARHQRDLDDKKSLRSEIETEVTMMKSRIERHQSRGLEGGKSSHAGEQVVRDDGSEDFEVISNRLALMTVKVRSQQAGLESRTPSPTPSSHKAPLNPLSRLLTSSDRNKTNESLLIEINNEISSLQTETAAEVEMLKAGVQEFMQLWTQYKSLEGDGSAGDR